MKRLAFIVIVMITCSTLYAQIKLPKGFYCVKANSHYRDNYFTDGKSDFHSEAWGRDMSGEEDSKSFIEKNVYLNKLVFKQTTDGLYWATGFVNNAFEYVIIIPEDAITINVRSNNKTPQFSNYSTWLLREVRKIRSKMLAKIDPDNTCYCFTNYLGKECGF